MYLVTPFVGVWIEINCIQHREGSGIVTPFVGVWIEMQICIVDLKTMVSLPSWECGLK